eukprot:4292094-Prymnesium_polylepis.2
MLRAAARAGWRAVRGNPDGGSSSGGGSHGADVRRDEAVCGGVEVVLARGDGGVELGKADEQLVEGPVEEDHDERALPRTHDAAARSLTGMQHG